MNWVVLYSQESRVARRGNRGLPISLTRPCLIAFGHKRFVERAMAGIFGVSAEAMGLMGQRGSRGEVGIPTRWAIVWKQIENAERGQPCSRARLICKGSEINAF